MNNQNNMQNNNQNNGTNVQNNPSYNQPNNNQGVVPRNDANNDKSKGSSFANKAGNFAKNASGLAANMVPGLGKVRAGINAAKKIGGAAKKAGGAASKIPKALSNLKNGKPFVNRTGNNNSNNQNDNTKKDDTKNGDTKKDKSNDNTKKDESNNKTKSDSKGGIGDKLKGGALSAASSTKAGKAIGKIIKIKKWLLFFSPLAFALLFLIIGLCITGVVFGQMLKIGEQIDGVVRNVVKFDDKFTNLISFNGFQTSSEVISTRLKEAKDQFDDYKDKCILREDNETDAEFNERVNSFGCVENDFDPGILISTIQENNTVDPKIYDVDDEGTVGNKEDYSKSREENYDQMFVDFGGIKSYFNAAADKTFLGNGDAYHVGSGQGLLYNLVDYKLKTHCVEKSLSSVGDIFNSYSKTFQLFMDKTGLTLDDIKSFLSILKDWQAMGANGMSFWDYVQTNASYNDILSKNNSIADLVKYADTTDCGDKIPVYTMVQFVNYENYVNYLKDTFIPTRYFKCDSCKKKNWTQEGKDNFIKTTINDIIDNRNEYYAQRNENNVIALTYDKDGNMHVDTASTYIGTFPVGTEGTGWKQKDARWGKIILAPNGGPDTNMANIGCLVTSISILMANSHTQITGDMFDPGVLAMAIKENNGFDESGSLYVTNASWRNIAPTFDKVDNINVQSMSFDKIKGTIADKMDQGLLVVAHVWGGAHFVPIVGAEDGKLIVSDPATDAKTTDFDNYENLRGGVVDLIVFKK